MTDKNVAAVLRSPNMPDSDQHIVYFGEYSSSHYLTINNKQEYDCFESQEEALAFADGYNKAMRIK